MTTDADTRHDSTESLAHLLGRVALVELAVREAVARRAASDPDPSDPTRGVFLSDDYLAWLLDRGRTPGESRRESDPRREQLDQDTDAAEGRGLELRLPRLSRAVGLDALDEELLVVAAAPMLDRRFGQFYGYLNDDVTRRCATVSLAVELAGRSGPGDPRDWLRLTPGAPLLRHHLLEVDDPDTPLPGQSLRIPGRVIAHLLGNDLPDPVLAACLDPAPPLPLVDPSLEHEPPRTVMIHQHPGTDAAAAAATWLAAHGPPALVARLPRDASGEQRAELVDLLLRETLLTGRPAVLGPVDELLKHGQGCTALQNLLTTSPLTVSWVEDVTELGRSAPSLEMLELPLPTQTHRAALWRSLGPGGAVSEHDLVALAAGYRVDATRIRRAVDTAVAAAPGRPPDRASLEDGLRAGDGAELQQQTHRIRPRRTWDDLVLPAETMTELSELVGTIRHRDELSDSWGLARGGSGRGVAALFVGPSGTGKTLAAEVLTREIGGDLYAVNLARIVNKYVGETEKNLDRLLSAAEGVAGVLFFDEADSLFGRRGTVNRAEDRYANLQISFLLQRVETVGAVVLLATNFRSQIDEAFIRRVDAVIEFPLPDAEAREAIWRRHTARVPLGDDVDLARCASTFELAGGNIRNAVAAAACLAADLGHPVRMADLVRGVEREFTKLGRLRRPVDFRDPPSTSGGAP